MYVSVLPDLPESWALLGEPDWYLEWLDSNGLIRHKTIGKGERQQIDLFPRLVSAVTAWPFWPEKGIGKGLFKPAGALFPYDIDGERIILSWKAGLDAVFYSELAIAEKKYPRQKVPRFPSNFNWPKFRELFADEILNEKIIKDPWLADWRLIAEKTVQSGFDRRRMVPQLYTDLAVPVPAGYWYSDSPFAVPLFFAEGNSTVFPASDTGSTWFCSKGVLRCKPNTWIFTEW